MSAVPMTVVETPFFLRKAADLLDEEERSELVAFVGANPDVGDVIPETGGVRKLRWSARGKGKRGGVAGDLLLPQRGVPTAALDGLCEKPEGESYQGGAQRPQEACSHARKKLRQG